MARKRIKITYRAPSTLTAAPTNPRKHTDTQIGQLADSIERFGFATPILVTDGLEIVAGHGCWAAAKRLGLDQIPCVSASGWTEPEIAAFRIADNQLGMNSSWDFDALMHDVAELDALGDFDLSVLGFDVPFLEQMTTSLANDAPAPAPLDGEDPEDMAQIDGGEQPDSLWDGVEGHEADEESAIYPVKSLIVHFPTEQDRVDFTRKLGVELAPLAPTLWYPSNPNPPRDSSIADWRADDEE